MHKLFPMHKLLPSLKRVFSSCLKRFHAAVCTSLASTAQPVAGFNRPERS